MKPIEKDELFTHLGQFLKTRGIELKDGSYAQGIQKSCGLLTDAINLSQKGVEKAKGEVDKKLDQLRQCIHEKTAPKPAAGPTVVTTAPAPAATAAAPRPAAPISKRRQPSAQARKPKPGKGKG